MLNKHCRSTYLILKVISEVHFSDVFRVNFEEGGDGFLTAVLEMAEELNNLLLVILSWFLTDHDPLLNYHLHASCHLTIKMLN